MVTQDKILIKRNKNVYVVKLQDIQVSKSIFTFNEFENVEIYNYIEDSVVLLENPYGKNPFKIKYGARRKITRFDYNDPGKNKCYFPEKYRIIIEKQKDKLIGFFTVKSNSLGNAVFDIRQIIDNFSLGLTLDFHSEISTSKQMLFDQSPNNLQDILDFIESKKEIMAACQYVIRNPIIQYEFGNQFVQTHNIKSFYNKKISYDNHSNKQLKNSLIELEKMCFEWSKVLRNIDENYMLRELKEVCAELQSITRMLTYVLTESWIKDINLIHGREKIYGTNSHNPYYNYIFRIVQDFKNRKYRLLENRRSLATKPTYQLYEIYILITLFRIFDDFNFKYENQESSGFSINYEDGIYCFKREGLKIDINYNKQVTSIDNYISPSIVSVNSRSDKPDFLLNIYRDDMYMGSYVIEVKCRHINNVYSNEFDQSVLQQCKDYLNFWYVDGDRMKRDPIKGVILLVPSANKISINTHFNLLKIMNIIPSIDFQKDESYFLLRKEIDNIIMKLRR